MKKLVRITTIPLSLDKLLGKQLSYMNQFFEVIAVSSDQKKLEKVARKYGVKPFCVPMTRTISPLKDLVSLWRMYQFLRKEKPEIVHSHTPKAGIIGMLAAYFAGVPNRFHTVAGLPLLEAKGTKRKVLNFVESLTYSFATKVYPNSFDLEKIILQEKFCGQEKLKVIGQGSSNGIDTTYFDKKNISAIDQENLKIQLGIEPDDFVFIFVGRLVRDKGIDELVSAFKDLMEQSSVCPEKGTTEMGLKGLNKEMVRLPGDHENSTLKVYKNGTYFYTGQSFSGLSIRYRLSKIWYRSAESEMLINSSTIDPSSKTEVNPFNTRLSDQGNNYYTGQSISGLNIRYRLSKVLYRSAESELVMNNSEMVPHSRTELSSLKKNFAEQGQTEQIIFPKVKLLLVGPLEQKLNPVLSMTLSEMERNPNIKCTGYVPDVRSFLAISKCLILPSYREGFPGAVLQAGAMNLPCIVTDINGCNEIIIDGFNGLIVPVKDEKSLGNAMRKILDNEELRTALTNNSRGIIIEKYDHNKVWEALLEEYEEACKQVKQ